ncbi:radical SAM family heme chaperone HemW [Bacteroidetes bacterium endosymbiont of Geopemphigus sp.]|uniref:radical SAM family heme chaperone HemW n=1 Tax=Bacteroidetes bacterium endosymbiont of Geopemphigus sp. TaxID=2047937 RepID=UPI000CD2E410|nr:radical SAM family heme chaperone HemW [Bacteroidetes bacterium endosymbiont of Geopemphigus sp.]
MAGIYLHIPFCKKKCHYCDFHFSTRLNDRKEMIVALCQELVLAREDFIEESIKTLYFGGGTPSLLSAHELNIILKTIYKNYSISSEAEITLEANPDDLSIEKLKDFYALGIRRLSIGVQSFFDEDLYFMNRSHTALEALGSIERAQNVGFLNISMDLIYGSPTTTDRMWLKNLDIALKTGVSHISSYALTIEPKTILFNRIRLRKAPIIQEETQARQYELLVEYLEHAGFIHYEVSNFGRKGCFSRHNTSYWKGLPYLGIGPSAHSFDGFKKRRWNVRNNRLYIDSIGDGLIPSRKEQLSLADRYNEYLLRGLRTLWGVNILEIKRNCGQRYHDYLCKEAKNFIQQDILKRRKMQFLLSKKYWFYADGITSDLFFTQKTIDNDK